MMVAVLSPLPARFSTVGKLFGPTYRARSVAMVVVLGLAVVGLFAYLYLREWWLKRTFRRFSRLQESRDRIGPPALHQNVPRESLVTKQNGSLSASSNSLVENQSQPPGKRINGNGGNGQWTSANLRAATRRGVLVIASEAEPCEIFVDGYFFGNAPARLKLPEGAHVIEVKMDGYNDYRREMQIIEGAELTVRPTLRRQNIKSGAGLEDRAPIGSVGRDQPGERAVRGQPPKGS